MCACVVKVSTVKEGNAVEEAVGRDPVLGGDEQAGQEGDGPQVLERRLRGLVLATLLRPLASILGFFLFLFLFLIVHLLHFVVYVHFVFFIVLLGATPASLGGRLCLCV
jgi:hypothetical protein